MRALALLAGLCSLGKAKDADGPRVVLYVEAWAIYARGFAPSDLDQVILQRSMPWSEFYINHSFFVGKKDTCMISTSDQQADFRADNGLYTPGWGQFDGWLGGYAALRSSYPDVKILPSIGGWSLSHTFQECTQKKSEVYMGSIMQNVKAFSFDGVDLDWEYPSCAEPCGCQGEATCPTSSNVSSPGDWNKYYQFLKALRAQLDTYASSVGKSMTTSMALGINISLLAGGDSPFTQTTYTDKTPIELLCDGTTMSFLNLMTYDLFGTWNQKTGPLAPLYNNDGSEDDDYWNIDTSVSYFISRCGNPKLLNMGLATYAKAWKDVPDTPGGGAPGFWQTSTNGSWLAKGSFEEGTLSWHDLVYNYLPSSSCTRTWIKGSEVPSLYCTTSPEGENNVFISYEDSESWKVKMQYARSKNMGGAIIWAASDMGTAALASSNGGKDSAKMLLDGLFTGWFGDLNHMVGPIGSKKSYTRVDYPTETPKSANRPDTIIPNCPMETFCKEEGQACYSEDYLCNLASEIPCDNCSDGDSGYNDGGGGDIQTAPTEGAVTGDPSSDGQSPGEPEVVPTEWPSSTTGTGTTGTGTTSSNGTGTGNGNTTNPDDQGNGASPSIYATGAAVLVLAVLVEQLTEF